MADHDRVELEADLRALGASLDRDLDDRDLHDDVLAAVRADARPAQLRPRGRRARRSVAIGIAALVAVLAIPPARAAVAGWLRIGAVEVVPPEAAPTTTAPPGSTAGTTTPTVDLVAVLGPEVPIDQVRAQLPLLVPTTPDLPAPQVRFEATTDPHASLVYPATADLPALPGLAVPGRDQGRDQDRDRDRDRVGLIVEEFAADGRTMVRKYLAGGTEVEAVDLDGDAGVFLTGEQHVVFYDDALGQDRQATGRTVGNALIFTRGPLTIRLEGDLGRDELVAIARSMR